MITIVNFINFSRQDYVSSTKTSKGSRVKVRKNSKIFNDKERKARHTKTTNKTGKTSPKQVQEAPSKKETEEVAVTTAIDWKNGQGFQYVDTPKGRIPLRSLKWKVPRSNTVRTPHKKRKEKRKMG